MPENSIAKYRHRQPMAHVLYVACIAVVCSVAHWKLKQKNKQKISYCSSKGTIAVSVLILINNSMLKSKIFVRMPMCIRANYAPRNEMVVVVVVKSKCFPKLLRPTVTSLTCLYAEWIITPTFAQCYQRVADVWPCAFINYLCFKWQHVPVSTATATTVLLGRLASAREAAARRTTRGRTATSSCSSATEDYDWSVTRSPTAFASIWGLSLWRRWGELTVLVRFKSSTILFNQSISFYSATIISLWCTESNPI